MKKIEMRNRIISFVLFMCLLLSTVYNFPIEVSAATAEEHTETGTEISNDYLKATIQSDKFKLYTTGGDPAKTSDDNKKLLYDCTSRTFINIDGTVTTFNPEVSVKKTPDGQSLYAVDTINGVKVEQFMSFAYNTHTSRYDCIEYKYVFTNVSTVDKTAGTRIFFDTMLGSNDQAPFIINGEQVTTARTYTGDAIPQTWQVLDSFTSPTVTAVGTVYNDISDRPDKVQFLPYSNGTGNIWDCTASGTIGDSAVNIYFNPTNLAPGETRTVKTYYGMSAAEPIIADGELVLTATKPVELLANADNTSYVGNPFTYTGFLTNENHTTYNNVTATITVSDGLTADSTSIALGNISYGNTRSFAVQLTAANRDTAANLTYSVTISADNLSDSIYAEYTIYVPALVHIHSYTESEYIDSNCTDYGIINYVCACGETKTTYIPPKGHHYLSEITVPATCTTPGVATHTCIRCSDSYTTYIYAEHSYSVTEFVEATCTVDGYYRYDCAYCDSYYYDIIPGAHSYVATVTRVATAETDGEITYTCSICGHTYTETIPARESANILLIQDRLPWTESVNTLLLARLFENGYITGWDQTTTANLASVDLSAYNVIMVANDQTTATYDQLAYLNSQIESFARAGGVVIYGACDHGWAGGNISYELPGGVTKGNYYSYRNYIVNGTHNVVTGVLTDGKSLTDALLYSTYSSHTYFTNLPADAVTILSDANGRPTLVEYPLGDGYIIASGITWEYTYVRDFVSGTSFAKCVYDDLIVHAALLSDPCDHEYDMGTVVEPTCTEKGYTIRTCSLCGATRRDDYVDALGHDYGDWIVVLEPTYTETGLKEKRCSRCADAIQEILPIIDGPVIRVEAPADSMILGHEMTFYLVIENLDPIKAMAITPYFDSEIFDIVNITWLKDAFLQDIDGDTLRSVSAWTELTDVNCEVFAVTLRAKNLTSATSVGCTLYVQDNDGMRELAVVAKTVSVISCTHTNVVYESINDEYHACICTDCGYTVTAYHSFAPDFAFDHDAHWHECTVCGGRKDVAAHDYDNICDATCNTCAYVRMGANIAIIIDGIEDIKSGSISIELDASMLELLNGEWTLPGAFMTDFNLADSRGVFAYVDPTAIGGNVFNFSVRGLDAANWLDALSAMRIVLTLENGAGELTEIVLTPDNLDITILYCHHYVENPADDYMITSATCTEAATYHVSCVDCGITGTDVFSYGDTLPHPYSDAWVCDENGHWHVCDVCGAASDLLDHEYDTPCDETCNVCGFERIPPHEFDEAWSYDAMTHWHECLLCDAISEYGVHEYGADRICDLCNYRTYLLGDVDDDDDVDSDDAIYLLYHIFFEDTGEYPIYQRCDFNGDGIVDSDDAIYLLYHIFFFEDTGEYPLYD